MLVEEWDATQISLLFVLCYAFITKNVEHVLMHCVKYNEERVKIQQRVREARQGWDLKKY